MPRRLSLASVVRRFRPRSSGSSTGHSSHILMRCSTRRSTTRRATDFIKSACGMLPKTQPHHPSPYLASALVERACRRGFSAHYVRAPRLLDDIAVSRIDGSYPRLLTRLAKFDLLAIDDWLLAPLNTQHRQLLMEVVEERAERASTLIASQLPIKEWHGAIGDPNHADAICDRLLHNAHRIELTGRSMRKTKTPPGTKNQRKGK